ncbi:MAG: helix-turn-helix domain-containing protein [Firmicutes bacterium]|uniref:Helix-turn-helix domain-containing protein n=1 Tax=Candidatus Onthovivens merdipullorum TaxID=2840889 RepID=A0A9D9GY48_9BACL|nr:helix-turn-helix domain-containing protein [Candidatus Onthovivens merdipullorum]
MIRYYLFKINGFTKKEFLVNIFKDLSKEEISIYFLNDDLGYFYSEDDLYIILDSVIKNINVDLNIDINILITHKVNKYYFELLNDSFKFYKNKIFSLYDLVLYFNLNNLKNYNLDIIKEFNNVPDYLINTMKIYLEANRNALLTSKYLFIHRNTFNQRLEKFIELTSLDIRDFYNANYFLLYLRIKENCVQGVHNNLSAENLK